MIYMTEEVILRRLKHNFFLTFSQNAALTMTVVFGSYSRGEWGVRNILAAIVRIIVIKHSKKFVL